MAKYTVSHEVITDVGAWWDNKESGCSEVELSDEEVCQIIDLIVEKEGETNIGSLALADRYPGIYEKLYNASHNAICGIGKRTGLDHYYYWSGNLMERCENELGFSYKPEENPEVDKHLALELWLDERFGSMDEESANNFVKTYFYRTDSLLDPQHLEVVIPDDVIWYAENKLYQDEVADYDPFQD